jgi:hypothetical protein
MCNERDKPRRVLLEVDRTLHKIPQNLPGLFLKMSAPYNCSIADVEKN